MNEIFGYRERNTPLQVARTPCETAFDSVKWPIVGKATYFVNHTGMVVNYKKGDIVNKITLFLPCFAMI